MSFPEAFPGDIQSFLRGMYGEPVSVSLLAGKSSASVFRCTFTFAAIILKAGVMRSGTDLGGEAAFYQRAAAHVRAARVPILDCYRIIEDAPEVWLVLEDIPTPLPKSRWTHPDSERLDALARLHTIPLTAIPRWEPIYQPAWPPDLTEKALMPFSTAARTAIAPRLEAIRMACQPNFARECWASADPNPRNWGIRDTGEAVLFGWERFTRAAPALDLALQIGSMGDTVTFQQHADMYCRVRERLGAPYSTHASELARAITLAKVWSVVEYLSFFAGTPPSADPVVDQLRSESSGSLVTWLNSLHLPGL